jgi:hypothetical protein
MTEDPYTKIYKALCMQKTSMILFNCKSASCRPASTDMCGNRIISPLENCSVAHFQNLNVSFRDATGSF